MPKIQRTGVFETNSSSAHSLAISKESKLSIPNLKDQDLVLDVFKYSFAGEPDDARVYDSFESKLSYIVASFMSYFYYDAYDLTVKAPEDWINQQETLSSLNQDTVLNIDKFKRVDVKAGTFTEATNHIDMWGAYRQLLLPIFEMVKEKTGCKDILFVQPELEVEFYIGEGKLKKEYGYWDYDRWNIETVTVGEEKIVRLYDLQWINHLEIEYELPLRCFFDLDFIERFLFNSKSYVRIGTDNGGLPIDPKICKAKSNEWVGCDSYPHLKIILDHYDFIYNGSIAELDNEKGEVNYHY